MARNAVRRAKRGRGVLWILVAVCTLAVVFGAGWWAAGGTFGSQRAATSDREVTAPVTVTAQRGKVGRVYSLGVGMETPVVPVGVNALAGVVTRVGEPQVKNGGLLYVVGEQGVIAVQASAPFYRDLGVGAKGPDVAAVQDMLIGEGLLTGEADGRFEARTVRALKEHQTALGVAATGELPLGTAVAIQSAPTTVTFSSELYPAAHLSGGEKVVEAPSGDRSFFVSVSASQVEFVPIGASVSFTSQGESFDGVVSDLVEMDDGSGFRAIVTAEDGSIVCGKRCDLLPSTPRATFMAQVRPEPEVEGIVIPTAAVRTRPTGVSLVTLAKTGEEREVSVLASGQGLVVVDGIEDDTEVLVHDPSRLSNGGSGQTGGSGSETVDETSPASTAPVSDSGQ